MRRILPRVLVPLALLLALAAQACDDDEEEGATDTIASDTTADTTLDDTAVDDTADDTDTTPPDDTSDGDVTGLCDGFPDRFERSCTVDEDCLVGFHQVDCCGTREAYGIARAAETDFDTAEAACADTWPACGCASQPTLAEDGQRGDEALMAPRCESGTCRSYLAP